jgi:hypothetical protein
MFNRSLAPIALSIALIGCEPVSPIIDGTGPAPADGEWKMEIIAAESHGACGAATDEDILGMVMGMDLETDGEHGIRFDLEGMSLKGYMDSGWMHAHGKIVEEYVTGVDVDVDADGDETDPPTDEDSESGHGGQSSDDSDGRSSAEPDSDRGMGVHATIEAITLTKTTMEGELVIEYDLPEMKCVMILDFEADHMDRGDRDEPVPVEPKEDPEKPEEQPYETDTSDE